MRSVAPRDRIPASDGIRSTGGRRADRAVADRAVADCSGTDVVTSGRWQYRL